MKPEIRELAGDLTYSWPDFKIQVDLTALHQTDAGAVRGMVKVTNGSGGQIYWNTFSLTGSTDRKALLQKLERSAKRGDGEWELDVDRMCLDAYERHVAVPDPIRLADVKLESLDVSYLFDPIVPLGLVTLLLADQGGTKSFLMLYLAVCTTLGIESVFGKPRRTGPVVYFDWEQDENMQRRRLGWVCRGLGVELPPDLFYVNMADRGRLIDGIREMRYQTEKLGAVLALIDSLTYATGGDLNSTEFSAPTMTAIGTLGNGVTKLISSHPNKATRNARVEDISVIGSALFEFRARAIWVLKRVGQRQQSSFDVKLVNRKPSDGRPVNEVAYRLTFEHQLVRFETGVPQLEDDDDDTKTGQIRAALRKLGKADTRQLAEWTGIPLEDVRKYCREAVDIFPVVVGRGRGNATVWQLGQPNPIPEQPMWWNKDD